MAKHSEIDSYLKMKYRIARDVKVLVVQYKAEEPKTDSQQDVWFCETGENDQQMIQIDNVCRNQQQKEDYEISSVSTMMSDRRIKGCDDINDQCLKKKFGIYKEPKIILCRHKEVLTSPIPPKHCATLASDLTERTEKHITIKELASSDAAKVINMDESSKMDSCFRKRYGIVQDVKVVLMQHQDKNIADSQNTACSSIPATNDNGAPMGMAYKNKQVEFHKSMLNVPSEEISENMDFENDTKRFVHSHKFCVLDPTKIRNPMDIDETIREEKIARLKRLLAEKEENLEKIRRK